MLNMFDPCEFTVVPLEKLTAHYVFIVGTPYVQNGCYLICWKYTYKAKDSLSIHRVDENSYSYLCTCLDVFHSMHRGIFSIKMKNCVWKTAGDDKEQCFRKFNHLCLKAQYIIMCQGVYCVS